MDELVGERERIDGEAAAWLAAIECGTADRAAFERWREADPAHALAFLRASQLDRELGLLRETGLADVPGPADLPTDSALRSVTRRRLLQAGAGSAALAAGTIGWSLSAAAQDARTAVGERRRIVIGKGLALDLNTDSHIRWRDQGSGFRIDLLKGELLLEREAGAAPCSIFCKDARIEPAVGRIDARLRGENVEVAVLHGDALVQTAGAGAIRITRLQRALLGKAGNPATASLSELQATATEAWQKGEIQFNGEPLDAAVAEYNRYLSRPLAIADTSIRQIKLGGRFSNSDPSDFLRALTVIYGVRVHEEADRIRLDRT